MSEKRKYDSTVARMAGNIAPALLSQHSGTILFGSNADRDATLCAVAVEAVQLARLIIEETARTEPEVPS